LKSHFPIGNGQLAFVYKNRSKNAFTLIFLHDSLGCIKTWRDFPQLLAQNSTCNLLVYDRLGHGESSTDPNALNRDQHYLEKEADILIELITQLEISSPILFGQSDGGSIALIAASKNETLIKGIIVEAAHIFVEEITLAGIRKAEEEYATGDLRGRLMKYHGSKTNDVFLSWTKTWLNVDFRDWNIESLLSKISCPCLILQGENDEFGSIRQVEGIEQGVQGSVQKVIVKNVGHTPHKENKDLTSNICSEFINSIKTK